MRLILTTCLLAIAAANTTVFLLIYLFKNYKK